MFSANSFEREPLRDFLELINMRSPASLRLGQTHDRQDGSAHTLDQLTPAESDLLRNQALDITDQPLFADIQKLSKKECSTPCAILRKLRMT